MAGRLESLAANVERVPLLSLGVGILHFQTGGIAIVGESRACPQWDYELHARNVSESKDCCGRLPSRIVCRVEIMTGTLQSLTIMSSIGSLALQVRKARDVSNRTVFGYRCDKLESNDRNAIGLADDRQQVPRCALERRQTKAHDVCFDVLRYCTNIQLYRTSGLPFLQISVDTRSDCTQRHTHTHTLPIQTTPDAAMNRPNPPRHARWILPVVGKATHSLQEKDSKNRLVSWTIAPSIECSWFCHGPKHREERRQVDFRC